MQGELEVPQVDLTPDKKSLPSRVWEKAKKARAFVDKRYRAKLREQESRRLEKKYEDRERLFETRRKLAIEAYKAADKVLTPIGEITDAQVARERPSLLFKARPYHAEVEEVKELVPQTIRDMARLTVTDVYPNLVARWSGLNPEEVRRRANLVGLIEISAGSFVTMKDAQARGAYQAQFDISNLYKDDDTRVFGTKVFLEEFAQEKPAKLDINILNQEPATPKNQDNDINWVVGRKDGQTQVIGTNLALFNQATQEGTSVTGMLQTRGWEPIGRIRIADRNRFVGFRTPNGDITPTNLK